MANKLIRPVKRGLSNIYGHKNVSVRNGEGTAWGWVQITIKNASEGLKNTDVYNQVREILMVEGLESYNFTADDGYDTQLDCVTVNIER